MTIQGTQSNQETPPPNPVTSEIARFLEQWDREVEAAQRALTGYAITARHDFITKRMQSFGDERMIEMMTLEAKKLNEANKAMNNASSTDMVRGENEIP